MKKILLPLYFFLVFYLTGVFIIENEVNYRTWEWIGASEFPQYHQSLENLLQPFLMLPLTLALIVSWFMICFKDKKAIRLLYLCNALLLTGFALISLFVMVPMHNQLGKEHDPALIHSLVKNNALYRTPIVVLFAVISLYLLYVMLSRGISKTVPERQGVD